LLRVSPFRSLTRAAGVLVVWLALLMGLGLTGLGGAPAALAASNALAVTATAATATTPAVPTDPFGRDNPRSAVSGLIDALGQRDYDRAAHYMAVRLDDPRLARGAAVLAHRLQALLDRGGTLKSFGALSSDPAGDLNDDLALDREDVGTITVNGEQVPVLLARSAPGAAAATGVAVWRVAPETLSALAVAHIPVAKGSAHAAHTAWMVAGAPLADWALLLGLAAASYAVLRLAATLVLVIARKVMARHQENPVYRFIQVGLSPLSLFLSVMLFFIWAEKLPVAIVARQTLLRYAGIVALVALVWFALRLIDAVAEVIIARMRSRQRRQVLSVITLLRRAAKILLLAFTAVGVLDTFGINVTTGIAALGIGGIALALGAQKTVENLVGSVTVIIDQPVQVGDFCKVGTVSGTVEDVGIRSTRIRTNDRTLVTIPNGDFASRQIENYATRDRFLFNPTIGIAYGQSAAKVRRAVEIVRETLLGNEGIIHEGLRATLTNMGDSALTIEVWSYLAGPDYGNAMQVRQDVLLTVMERFEAEQITLAQPTSPVVVVQDGTLAPT